MLCLIGYIATSSNQFDMQNRFITDLFPRFVLHLRSIKSMSKNKCAAYTQRIATKKIPILDCSVSDPGSAKN